MWLAFSCSGEVLIASCVKMQLAHVSLVCLVFAAGFVNTEGKDILLVLTPLANSQITLSTSVTIFFFGKTA